MDKLFLIAHKVRGEASFDVAIQLNLLFSDSQGGPDEVVWIIPTSGHRAYPYNFWSLSSLEGDVGQGYWGGVLTEMPSSLRDHYHLNDDITSRPTPPSRRAPTSRSIDDLLGDI